MTGFQLPLAWARFTVTHSMVVTTTDRYGDTTTKVTTADIDGCLHAPSRPSEDDHRVIIPATLYMPGSRTIGDDDFFTYPNNEKWEVIGGGADWLAGTTVQVKRWGRTD